MPPPLLRLIRRKRIAHKIRDAASQEATNSKEEKAEEMRLMRRWQLLTSVIEGIDIFIWNTLISSVDRKMLAKDGIVDTYMLISCVLQDDTEDEITVKAKQVYGTIPVDYIDLRHAVWILKKGVTNDRRSFAQPTITLAEFLQFATTSLPQYRKQLLGIADVQVLTGELEYLFSR